MLTKDNAARTDQGGFARWDTARSASRLEPNSVQRRESKMRKSHVTLLGVTSLALAALTLFSTDASAYPRYRESDGNTFDTYCSACHGDFRASPYESQADGSSWGNSLHNVHRTNMLGGDCDTCHLASGRFPVMLDSAAGGDGLAPVSCVGCHGRTEDDSVANGGLCNPAIAGACGPGAGLQQHHARAGVTVCANCHDNADPANYMPVGEDIPPPYYANPGNGHPDIPSDPCNDDFIGGSQGLDNDGDGDYDGNDTDCGPPVCTTDAECDNGEFCDGAETCDTNTGECVPGTPVDVDDGVGCTDDSCDEANDVVVNAPNDGLCDNGQFCDGAETCDATNDCQAGTPVDVDDGVGCTDDSCDEANDVVVNAPNDGLCDNGQFCDGAETCDATNDCQDGTPPCDPATETCDEQTDSCELVVGGVDLDIAQFRAPKRYDLSSKGNKRRQPIRVRLVITNAGGVDEPRPAMITALLPDGSEVVVFDQVVADAVGDGRTTYTARYRPTQVGEIRWTATVMDDDADVDMATAVTTVVGALPGGMPGRSSLPGEGAQPSPSAGTASSRVREEAGYE